MGSILLVGGVGVGKTTLRQRLQNLPIQYLKTQAIEAIDNIVDSPGEYLEIGRLNHVLQQAAFNVEVVVLVHAADSERGRFRPGYASTFGTKVVGIVTKCDLATKIQVDQAAQLLTIAGADPIWCVDSVSGKGFDDVVEALCQTSL